MGEEGGAVVVATAHKKPSDLLILVEKLWHMIALFLRSCAANGIT